jgi:hypothetical protein
MNICFSSEWGLPREVLKKLGYDSFLLLFIHLPTHKKQMKRLFDVVLLRILLKYLFFASRMCKHFNAIVPINTYFGGVLSRIRLNNK